MHVSCSQKDLSMALTIVSKAVDVNNTLPVLNNVLLKAEDKKLHFTATNLEVVITYNIDAEVKNEGEITLPAKLLSNYVNYLKDDKIDLLVEGQDVQLKTSDSKIRIKGIPSSDFPPIPLVEKEGELTLAVKDLKKALNQVVFAATLNTTRPILGGVYFSVQDTQLKIVSTDSYRLSEKKISFLSSGGVVDCIVPAKTILELTSVLDGLMIEKLDVVTSKNQIMFSAGSFKLVSRLIEGQFPNYEQIIPKSSKTQLEFEANTLALVLKRINIFAKENNNKIIFRVLAGEVVVTTESTQYGEGEITVKGGIKGEDNEIALNSQFLLEALNHSGGDKVILEIGEKISPVILRLKDDEAFLHIIMPLKI